MIYKETITADGIYPLNDNYPSIDILSIDTYGTYTLDGATVTLCKLIDSAALTTTGSWEAITTYSTAPNEQRFIGGEVLALVVSSAGASTSLPIRAKDLHSYSTGV